MTATLRIATRMGAVTTLPDAARHAALVSLADGLACMMAATGGDNALADHAAGCSGPATLLARRGRVPAAAAALGNGALAHAADFEDTFEAGMIHPNASVIPAVLALAEELDADGPRILLALATGCDVACRLSLVVGNDPAARGWYHPPMITGVGAAFAAARMLDLSPQQTVDAVGLALCQFSLGAGLKSSPRSDLRAVREGFAARAAVEGARMAQLGLRATEDPLFGPGGLIPLLTGEDRSPEPLLDGLGARFHGPEVAIKRWPSCRGTHGPVQLALELRAQGITDVADVAMRVAPLNRMLFQPTDQKHRPQSVIDAKFSSPFCFAVALRDGEPTLPAFLPSRLTDPETLAIAAKVRMIDGTPDAELEADVRLKDGTIRHFALRPTEWRVSDMTLADLRPKVRGCADASAHAFDAELFLDAVGQVQDRGVAPILALLAP